MITGVYAQCSPECQALAVCDEANVLHGAHVELGHKHLNGKCVEAMRFKSHNPTCEYLGYGYATSKNFS